MSAPSSAAISHPWDPDALLLKARRYIEQMLEHNHSDWQFAFWSSLALELIARAALAKASPALLADKDDWRQVYFALGHTPKAQRFVPKSVGTAEVLNRLQDIYATFDKELRDFCSLHTGMRNAELHSADLPFEDLKPSAWLSKFYRSCEVLLQPLAVDLENLLGPEEAAFAKQQIAAGKDEAAKAVLSTINSFKTVWEAKPADERKKLVTKAEAWATRQEGHVVKCPACGSDALLEGDPISAPKKTLKDELVVETQSMSPSTFQCVACNLKISGLSQLSAAGLGAPFKATSTYDLANYLYPDGQDDRYDDDNNEPF